MSREERSLKAVLKLDSVLGKVSVSSVTFTAHEGDSEVRYAGGVGLLIPLEIVFSPGEVDVDNGTSQPNE